MKKMYDFVRAKTRKEAHLRDTQADEYDFEGFKTVPSSLSRKQWSPDDQKCIEERFEKFDQLPIKSAIMSIFRQDPVLRYVLDSEGKDRLLRKGQKFLQKESSSP